VVDPAGKVVFDRKDVESGQQVFLKYALMQNGSIWGHGAYLGPDFSAAYIYDPEEVRQLTAFFAWSAWASVANRPDKPYSYTNNFPYDPAVGNLLTADALLWSALSVAMLLAGLALVLFIFGRFDYLGWKGEPREILPRLLPGGVTAGQVATIKYFLIVALLFLAQVTIGSALAHYRAEPGDFYGIDLAQFLPSNILRTWHLQLALFWIATAYIAGGLLLASSVGRKEPRGHSTGIHLLFWALVVLVAGSLWMPSFFWPAASSVRRTTGTGRGRPASPWLWPPCFRRSKWCRSPF
jgi:nitric oxide reductase large subunit